MTDFYTKKQRKYWCEKCRIFVEYNKPSIDKHNSSRNHLNNVASEGKYNSIKKKYANYINGLNDISNINKQGNINTNANINTNSSDNSNNSNNNKIIGRKVHRSNNINEQYNRESIAYLKEIQNEIMKEQLMAMQTNKEAIEAEKEGDQNKKKWGVYWDETYQLPYYYNFTTGESVWDKPIDYDGIQEDIDNLINNNINDTTSNTIQKYYKGEIGKWETVEECKSVFGKKTIIEANEDKK